jgi:hypothetical protein
MVGARLPGADAAHRVEADRHVLGVGDLEECQRLQLFARVAEHVGKRAVRLDESSVEPDHGDADGRILHGAAEALLAFRDAAAVAPRLVNDEAGDERQCGDDRDGKLEAVNEAAGGGIEPAENAGDLHADQRRADRPAGDRQLEGHSKRGHRHQGHDDEDEGKLR